MYALLACLALCTTYKEPVQQPPLPGHTRLTPELGQARLSEKPSRLEAGLLLANCVVNDPQAFGLLADIQWMDARFQAVGSGRVRLTFQIENETLRLRMAAASGVLQLFHDAWAE